MALEGGRTPSDITQKQSGSLTLPLGGVGTSSDTARQQHGGPPASNIVVADGTRQEGGTDLPEAAGASVLWLTTEDAATEVEQ